MPIPIAIATPTFLAFVLFSEQPLMCVWRILWRMKTGAEVGPGRRPALPFCLFATHQAPSGEAVSKRFMERAFSPFACCDHILGLRPRLIWNAPLALPNI